MSRQGRGFLKILGIALFIIPSLGSAAGNHSRLAVGAGFGGAQLTTIGPSNDIRLGSGAYFNVEAEKPFGSLPVYFEAGLQYTHASGSANYSYLSSTNINYVQNNVNVALDDFGFNVGIRLKIFDNSAFRPYIEAGGDAGYFQLTYDSSLRSAAITSLGNDFKTIDGALDFGFYGEGGFEVDLTETFSLRAGYRYINNSTRAVDTLRKQQVTYTNGIIYGGLAWHF